MLNLNTLDYDGRDEKLQERHNYPNNNGRKGIIILNYPNNLK